MDDWEHQDYETTWNYLYDSNFVVWIAHYGYGMEDFRTAQ
jgi:hypothetical protein